ncbi:hypothetical protein AK830_g895 [Neonectria ditissima]|uniref:Uncharacterized protein n=1 Tax=Neonectria ditissima TaxID=78410 RepID=A0A0P7B6P6_9HYPO|nr:hypothetical protein AK830_g895 [Neonectria ditissima]
MKPSTVYAALALGLSPFSAAWVFPRHLPDGVYHITLPNPDDTAGKATIVKRAQAYGDKPRVKPEHRLIGEPQADTDFYTEHLMHNQDMWNERPPALQPHDGAPGDRGDVPFVLADKVHDWDCVFREPPLERAAYLEARANLMDYCDRWALNGRSAHIAAARRGETVVYACSYDWNPAPCSRREFRWAEEHYMDPIDKCGELRSAWVYSRKVERSYGRGWAGSNICEFDAGFRSTPDVDKLLWIGRPPSGKKKPEDKAWWDDNTGAAVNFQQSAKFVPGIKDWAIDWRQPWDNGTKNEGAGWDEGAPPRYDGH